MKAARGLLASFVFAAPVAAVPPPPNWGAAATNCAAPVYAIDRLVCEDPQLRLLDQAIGVRVSFPAPSDAALRPSHDEWYRQSRLCASQADAKGCILNAYLARLKLLGPIAPAPAR